MAIAAPNPKRRLVSRIDAATEPFRYGKVNEHRAGSGFGSLRRDIRFVWARARPGGFPGTADRDGRAGTANAAAMPRRAAGGDGRLPFKRPRAGSDGTDALAVVVSSSPQPRWGREQRCLRPGVDLHLTLRGADADNEADQHVDHRDHGQQEKRRGTGLRHQQKFHQHGDE